MKCVPEMRSLGLLRIVSASQTAFGCPPGTSRRLFFAEKRQAPGASALRLVLPCCWHLAPRSTPSGKPSALPAPKCPEMLRVHLKCPTGGHFRRPLAFLFASVAFGSLARPPSCRVPCALRAAGTRLRAGARVPASPADPPEKPPYGISCRRGAFP